MTEKDYAEFRRHLEVALEHMNTLVIWIFISLVSSIAVRGNIDTVFDWVMMVAGSFAGGMAALNTMWGWRSLVQARAIIKRNRS